MKNHLNVQKIKERLKVFFDPRTKFGKNTKISFLRQEIFKRMELVMVYIPFTISYFLNPDDFISDLYPNFKVYITMGLCIEALRTTFTYLVIYVYNWFLYCLFYLKAVPISYWIEYNFLINWSTTLKYWKWYCIDKVIDNDNDNDMRQPMTAVLSYW